MIVEDFTIGYITMNPHDYRKNTDWLTMAETNKGSTSITIPNGTVSQGQTYLREFDFSANAVPGAIDRIQISIADTSQIGAYGRIILGDAEGGLSVYRKSAATLTLRVELNARSSSGSSWPQTSVEIAFSSFRPPNVL